MRTLFNKNSGIQSVPTQINSLVTSLQQHVNSNPQATSQVARTAFSMESISESQKHSLDTAADQLSAALESITAELGLEKTLTKAQINAGTIAGIVAGDYRGFLAQKTDHQLVSTENMAVVANMGISDAMSQRSFSLESYDERENRNAVVYSIAYNMQSARQEEFAETFFPTIVITPDNVGFGVTVNLMMVYDGIERKITGSFEDFKKKNIIRAVTDHTVLRKEQTRVVPVHRPQSADKFISAAVVAPASVMLEGEAVNTAPIAVGKRIDLIGLGQTDSLVASGVMDMTDSLDPYINLSNVYVTVGTDVLKFSTLNVPLSNFIYSPQSNYRVMTLNFTSTSLLLNKNTKQADGSALTTLAGIVTGDLIVRLDIAMTGSVNIETGECSVYGNAIGIHSVQDATGVMLDLASAPSAALVTAVSGGAIEGYDIQAYRTNMNRRQRGQLIDVTKFTQLYNVPLRSPITTIHPINTDGTTDASDVQALITATRIRTSNEAITALINSSMLMREYVDVRDMVGAGPDVLGVGRFFIRPTFFEETLDMTVIVDSLKSHERAQDIQAALVNKIRDYAYRMYRDSEYKAAADAIQGGIAATPVVIIGTDPVIARYLNVTGDLRTLGSEFDVRIVSTLDKRIAGKIFVTFGVFDENRNVAPNPLNFGNMIWAPEMVLTANISRGNTISKETVVQPRYNFVTHMPIMTVLQVNGIKDVLNKVVLKMDQV